MRVISKLIVIFSMACIWISQAEAIAPFARNEQIGINGLGNLVAVWKGRDTANEPYRIQATTGPLNTIGTWLVVDITSSTTFETDDPILAVSKATTGTLAAFIWRGHNIFSGNRILQIATLSTSGVWSAPFTLSLDDGTEYVVDHYELVISDDGNTIVVTWTALMLSPDRLEVRSRVSIDGGQTWTTPIPVSLS